MNTLEYTWRTHFEHTLDHNGSLAHELWKLVVERVFEEWTFLLIVKSVVISIK